MNRQRPGVSDTTLVAALAALFGACAAFWLASGIGGYLTHGRWPDISLVGTGPSLQRLFTDPGDPMSAWPPQIRSQLPSAQVFYSVLAVLLLVMLALVYLVVRIRMGGRTPTVRDQSSREVIARTLSASAVRKRAAARRPASGAISATTSGATPGGTSGSAFRRRSSASGPPPGVYLGRDVDHGIHLYGSLEDSYCVVGPPRSGKTVNLVTGAVLDAPGAVIVASARADTLRQTWDERERRGPVHLFDPQDLAGWVRRLAWAPEQGCDDPPTAIRRARALTSGLRQPVHTEPEQVQAHGDHDGSRHGPSGHAPWTHGVTSTAQAVVRCYLHAAAIDGRGIRHVRPWLADPSHAEPVGILRESSLAADGWAAELDELGRIEGDRRIAVWDAVREAFAWLSDPRVVEDCSPARTNVFDPSHLLGRQGTLYLIGSGASEPATAPLITALVEDVVELGRRVAARSPDGRLDPPLLLMLDDVTSVAPLPSLVPLMAEGGGLGITPVAVLQSVSQARARWGSAQTAALWEACTVKVVLGGLAQAHDLDEATRPAVAAAGSTAGPGPDLHSLPAGQAVVLHRYTGPVQTELLPWWKRPGAQSGGPSLPRPAGAREDAR
jgi:type IV secretion system protein VirD4